MKKSSFVLIVLIGISLVVWNPVVGLEYRAPCTLGPEGQDPCISSIIENPLKCTATDNVTAGICGCEDDMFYNREMGICVSEENQKCTLRAGDGGPMRTCTEFAECYPHVVTPPLAPRIEGVCLCDLDAAHDSVTGECKLQYESSRCRLATHCDMSQSLTCINGECGCINDDHHVWDVAEGRCVTLVGGSCDAGPREPNPKCSGSSECHNTTCQCVDGMIGTPDKRSCGKPHSATCQNHQECHPQFNCLGDEGSKTCQCPTTQYYHKQSEKCQLKVGETCHTQSDLDCTANAACTSSGCACNPNYEAGDNGLCVGLYNTPCDEAEDLKCSDSKYLECQPTSEGAPEKHCVCKEKYHIDGSKCQGEVGQSCGNRDDNCVANSVCSSGTCECRFLQEADFDNLRCTGKYGAVCDNSMNVCSGHRFLSCNFNSSLCDCADLKNQLPDDTESCVAKANTSCDSGIGCVENATCIDTVAPNMCKCNKNFVPKGGRCVRGTTGSGARTLGSAVLIITIAFLVGKA